MALVASDVDERMSNESINPDMSRQAAASALCLVSDQLSPQHESICGCAVTEVPTVFSLLQGSAGPQGNPGPKGVRVSTPPAPPSSRLLPLICQKWVERFHFLKGSRWCSSGMRLFIA